jgi:hypothetical protein
MKWHIVISGVLLWVSTATLVQAEVYEDFESYNDTADMLANSPVPLYYAGTTSNSTTRTPMLETATGADGTQSFSITQTYVGTRTSTAYWFQGWKFDLNKDGTIGTNEGIDLTGYSAIRLWYKGDANNADPGINNTRIEIKDRIAGLLTQVYLDGAMTNSNWTMVEIPVEPSWTQVGYIVFRAYQPAGTDLTSKVTIDRLEFVPPQPEPQSCRPVVKEFYAAPQTIGNGSGLTPADASSYKNTTLWNTVKTELNNNPVKVWFLDGTYTSGKLELINVGNDQNLLTLQAMSDDGAVFSSAALTGSYLYMGDCKNIRIKDLKFTGDNVTTYALICTDIGTGSKYIEIDSCTFEEMNHVNYGAIGISYGDTHHISVHDCTFRRVGFDDPQPGYPRLCHMMYIAYEAHHLYIYNNLFEDCSGIYVKIRDSIDHTWIVNNTFRSTGTYYLEDGYDDRGLCFISNATHADDTHVEYWSSDVHIAGNTFEFAPGATTPRIAYQFYMTQYDPPGVHYALSPEEAAIMLSGAPSAKRDFFLNSAGVDLYDYSDRDNSYTNVSYKAAYSCYGAGDGVWKGNAEIYDAFGQNEMFKYGFEEASGPLQGLYKVDSPPNTAIDINSLYAANGFKSLAMIDSSSSSDCSISRPIDAIGKGYFSAWYRFSSGGSDRYCLISNNNIYWLIARSTGVWANSNGTIGRTPTSFETDRWYHIEIVFDCSLHTYSIFVDGAALVSGWPIPSSPSAMSGEIKIKPADISGLGTMFVDDIELASLDESTPGIEIPQISLVDHNQIKLTFDSAMDDFGGSVNRCSILNPSNYSLQSIPSLSNELSVTSVTSEANDTYILNTAAELRKASYKLMIKNIRNATGSVLSGDSAFKTISGLDCDSKLGDIGGWYGCGKEFKDCTVDIYDLRCFIEEWLHQGVLCPDINNDNIVNFKDYSTFSDEWLN